MKASKDEINNLKKLQEIDAQIKNEVSNFENLPERDSFCAVKSKLDELNEKYKKVDAMKKDVDKRFSKMTAEEASLIQRQESVQKSIDEAAGDFRNLEVHTKELDSISSRRNTLSEMMLKMEVEQEKVNEIDKKLMTAIEQVKAKGDELQKKLEEAKKTSAQNVRKLSENREKVYASLPKELARLYDDAVGKVGNVVLTTLDGNSCSVCRTQIEEGKLFEIQKSGGVSACPVCGRIIVIED